MGATYKERGGGKATGLGNDLIQFLSQGLNTGTFGAGNAMGNDSYGQTMGIAGVLNDLLMGGAGNIGGAQGQVISQGINDQAGELRSRFGVGGGTAFGTGAQYAEGTMRAQAAPQLAMAGGQLQLNALSQLLPMFASIAGRGMSQRQGIMQPHPLASAASIAAPIIGAGLGMMARPPGAASSMAAGSLGTPGFGGGGLMGGSTFNGLPMQAMNGFYGSPSPLFGATPSFSPSYFGR